MVRRRCGRDFEQFFGVAGEVVAVDNRREGFSIVGRQLPGTHPVADHRGLGDGVGQTDLSAGGLDRRSGRGSEPCLHRCRTTGTPHFGELCGVSEAGELGFEPGDQPAQANHNSTQLGGRHDTQIDTGEAESASTRCVLTKHPG